MKSVELEEVRKEYSDVVAVDDVSLSIEKGELLVLLGPSGCGKTTTLRMIAGLEYPTTGRVRIDGEDVTDTIPKNRDIAMVFQDLALYPHMSVRENMGFPLKMAGVDKERRDQVVEETAEMVEIPELLDRSPEELSGGQQQRVALGRTLVREPAVFLMDEPLSSLDAKLRETMRTEILDLHQKLEQAMVYVTHDQEIAMTLGDRIAVMNEGVLQQVADPTTIYQRPANEFIARFIGSPDMNFFSGSIDVGDGTATLSTPEFTLRLTDRATTEAWKELDGTDVNVGIRPQHIYDPRDSTGTYSDAETVAGEVTILENIGAATDVHVEVDESPFVARVDGDTDIEHGDSVTMGFDTSKLHVFDPDTEERIESVDALLGTPPDKTVRTDVGKSQ